VLLKFFGRAPAAQAIARLERAGLRRGQHHGCRGVGVRGCWLVVSACWNRRATSPGWTPITSTWRTGGSVRAVADRGRADDDGDSACRTGSNLAWGLTIVLLVAGAGRSLRRRNDRLWVAGVLVLTTMLLAPFRACFYRHANLLSGPLQPSSAMSLIVLVICLLALVVTRPHTHFLTNNAWWAVILSRDVSNSLRLQSHRGRACHWSPSGCCCGQGGCGSCLGMRKRDGSWRPLVPCARQGRRVGHGRG